MPEGFLDLKMDASVLLLYSLLFASYSTGIIEEKCDTPQYLAVGKSGMIECSFQEGFHTVLWYNSTELAKGKALLQITEGVKEGPGYDSGEYDVCANGSLTINNVTLEHEQNFTVFLIKSQDDDPVSLQVEVIVTAQTFIPVPLIDNCDNTSEICFQILYPDSDISCTVRDARPAIPLDWMVRSFNGDRNISSRFEITNEVHTYFTSRVTTSDPFLYSDILTLLVCKANGPPGLLDRNESLLLLQNNDGTLTDVEPQNMFVEKDSRVELNCTHRHISYLVWQVKQSSDMIFRNILYAVYFGKSFMHTNDENFSLQNTSSIVVDNVRIHQEGTYRCISGNGFEDNFIVYDVVVFVRPDPAYLVVDGCNHQQYCVLEVPAEGSLTCIVKRIRPQVDLDFTELIEPSSNAFYFYDKSITIKENGDTFDVLLTSKYSYSGAANTRLSVECKVLGTNIDELHLATKFDLLFLQGAEATTEATLPSNGHRYWIIAVVLAVVLLVFVGCGFVIVKVQGRRRMSRRKNYRQHRHISHVRGETETQFSNGDRTDERGKIQYPTGPEEVIPRMSTNYSAEKKDMFISELKAKYQDLYDAVQPIPYIRDRLYCVDRVFVEGGIEYLVAKDKMGGHGTWGKLSSYHNILDDDRVKSTRRILEGEPGYGKSTLTLQLSYDWCNKIQQSYLKDTEVLILLRLRQLGGVTSVYRAIKQFLLPKDSKLTESDVADIIGDCSSVLVILDGYDEYPDQDSGIDSDVISIVRRKMFQQFEVILTTRSSYLPKKYPEMTKRLKLTGFDDNARDQYIRKAVVGDEVEAVEKIKQRLNENPVLSDLCQVPLFFVMFAHMSHESAHFQKFNSVTSFFRYMISCFHSHMKNKMEDENVKKYDLFEADHRELDKLAFEGLSGKDQQIVWNKKDMCERLGHEFYDQYVGIGILVEEEVLDISDDPGLVISEHIQYKTEVRFYHKLFCEWYAAYHLSSYASKENVTFDNWEESDESEQSDSDKDSLAEHIRSTLQETIKSHKDHYLKYVDPFDLQYVYRFTCGLNHVAAEKIIGYLKTRKDASKFVILCILEESGKVEDVLQDVEALCSRIVQINSNDSLLLQRSTIQLLEIAFANKISISHVNLINCYSTVYLSGGYHLQLKSNLYIPVLTTLNKLTIHEEGREISVAEFTDILQYSSKCLALKKLRFFFCLLPESVQAESVSILRSRNVTVLWYPSSGCYRLNLESRHWERQRYLGGPVIGVITDDNYQSEVEAIRKLRKPEKGDE